MAKQNKKNNRMSNDINIKEQLTDIKTELKDGVFIFTGPLSISDFSNSIKKPANEIIMHFFKKGKLYNLNSILSEEEISETCFDFDFDFQKEIELNESNFIDNLEINDDEEHMESRPPIITIMGHVDHGKTTLLDKIRNSNVVSSESGGITQHTGAYQIEHKKRKMTFLDTPGHEAFSAMRSRGAKVTDIIILVVAADDGVMPQTIEAIDHAKAADVPIIVFVNKMDKVGANPDNVKGDLSKLDILSEDWGGQHMFIYGSALKGENLDKLFEAIILQADVLDLKANPKRNPIGTVIESFVTKGRGTVATLIITNGTIYPRDFIVAGSHYGRIKSLEDANNNPIEFATPGTPVLVTGLNYTPNAGDKFIGFENEKFAKQLANKKAALDKINELNNKNQFQYTENDNVVNVIVKSDVHGTAEAIKGSLTALSTPETRINVIRATVGSITKSDILLAEASKAIIYGFNTKIDTITKQEAERSGVRIKISSIIYELIEDLQTIITSFKEPEYEEFVTGQALIQKIFFYSKVGNIAGCLVTSGSINRGTKIRLIRKNKVVHEGRLDSLQNNKDQIKKADMGKEFGTHIKGFNDIQVDDIIEAYEERLKTS